MNSNESNGFSVNIIFVHLLDYISRCLFLFVDLPEYLYELSSSKAVNEGLLREIYQ